MAHQDDFEFNAGGLFALLRSHYGSRAEFKIMATTKGAAGHHNMDPEQTFQRRAAEAKKSAEIIKASYECLRCLDGNHLPGQVFIDQNFLGGLWNGVRAFEPDFIFCPPVISDPLAGIHIDHYNTAMAVRMVAYQLTVPHAYPTMFRQLKLRVTYPVIINVDDPYAGETGYDLALDISRVYPVKLKMALCHESQIFEWLPWNSGEKNPISRKEFTERFRKRHSLINTRYGNDDDVPREYFRLTQWGRKIKNEELKKMLFH